MIDLCGWSVKEVMRGQRSEPWIGQVKAYGRGASNEFPDFLTVPKDMFFLEGDILFCKYEKRPGNIKSRVVFPPSLVEKAIHMIHVSPCARHIGIERSLKRAQEPFFWVGMKKDVVKFISQCHICNTTKNHRQTIPKARMWPVEPSKFARVHTDVVGPFSLGDGQFRYVYVMVDEFTRYTHTHAMVDKSAVSVARALSAFIVKFS